MEKNATLGPKPNHPKYLKLVKELVDNCFGIKGQREKRNSSNIILILNIAKKKCIMCDEKIQIEELKYITIVDTNVFPTQGLLLHHSKLQLNNDGK
jgi:hypothetical protein